MIAGVVDPISLVVTLSKPLIFADDSWYDTYFDLVGLSAYRYLIVYYVGSSTNQAVSAVVMNVQKYPTNDTYYVQPLGPVAYLAGSLATGVIRVTALSSNSAVIAYSDVTSNYGITCAMVKVNPLSGVVNFISVLQITTGYTVKYISSGTVDIKLVTISGGSQFMVMFSDLGLDGAIVAAIGTVSSQLLL